MDFFLKPFQQEETSESAESKKKPPSCNSVKIILQKWGRNTDFETKIEAFDMSTSIVQETWKEIHQEVKKKGKALGKITVGKIPFLLPTNLTSITFVFSDNFWINEWQCYKGHGEVRNTVTLSKLKKTNSNNYNRYGKKT